MINQEKSELKSTQVFSFVGYEYHLDSALVKPIQERWLKLQDLILRLKSKHVLTARCLMSLIGLLSSMEKMVPEGKKATHKCSRVEGSLPGLSKLQGPVPEPNSVSCNGQISSGSLHKQTRRNSLSRDVRSPVEDHDMVPSLSHNIKSQTHSRVSECDGRPPVQVQPSAVNRMFKQICQKWFTPHVDLFATHLNHKLPLYVSPVPDPNAWDIDALNLNWTGLTAYAYSPTALLHRMIQKIRQSHCLIIVIAPGWPGMPWFWDLVQLSTEIPLQLPVSTTLLKQPHNYVFHSNPQYLNLHT